jgi:hypothetical protein
MVVLTSGGCRGHHRKDSEFHTVDSFTLILPCRLVVTSSYAGSTRVKHEPTSCRLDYSCELLDEILVSALGLPVTHLSP